MQKAIGYIRVSTVDQVQNGISLDAQRSRIESWCNTNGYELAGVHVDGGISGKRADNRPGLQRALSDVCKVKGALVVYSLSRMSRSVKDAIGISEKLSASGADLVSLSERIDTTSPSGRLIFNIFSSLSQFERELVSQRTNSKELSK
jgi:DNA invertase Pin-like site-specific DNA recombinase